MYSITKSVYKQILLHSFNRYSYLKRHSRRLIMNNFKNDILIGLLLITGVGSFIYGQFIISTVSFAVAAIYSNIAMRARSHH